MESYKIKLFFGFAKNYSHSRLEAGRLEIQPQNPHRTGGSGSNGGLSTGLSYPHSDFMLKQEVRSLRNLQPQSQISIPNGFTLYGQTNGGTSNDGYWLYKDDQKILYLFKYNPNTNEITKIQRSIFDK